MNPRAIPAMVSDQNWSINTANIYLLGNQWLIIKASKTGVGVLTLFFKRFPKHPLLCVVIKYLLIT